MIRWYKLKKKELSPHIQRDCGGGMRLYRKGSPNTAWNVKDTAGKGHWKK